MNRQKVVARGQRPRARLVVAVILTSGIGFAQLQPLAPAAPQPQQPPPAAPAQQPPAQQPPTQPPTQPQQGAGTATSIGPLSLLNVSLTEVIDKLAQQLHINYTLDPRVKGSVYLNTYGETKDIDPRNLLELILHINGFGMVANGPIYRIVPLSDVSKQPIHLQVNAQDIPDDDQLMLNLYFLKYMTVDEISTILSKFTDATISSYAPANLLFVLDTHRNMRHTNELIELFDSDMFVNQRVRLYELKNAKPSDVEKELEAILKSISLDPKNSTVRFLAIDHISLLIAVAPNPGVFETVEKWIEKLDVPVTVTAGAIEAHVYHVKYGRADCLAQALTSLFGGFGAGGGYGGYGGYGGGYGAPANAYASPNAGAYGGGGTGYGNVYGGGGGIGGGYGGGAYGGYGGAGAGTYGAPNNFSSGFGGAGACGQGVAGGGGFGGGYGGAYGNPAFGGYSAQVPMMGGAGAAVPAGAAANAPAAASAAGAGTNATGATPVITVELPPRIVALSLDNSLLIQADPQKYQSILKMLKELDVPPRQILLEAKIYSVDLVDQFASGIQAYFQKATGNSRTPFASLVNGGTVLSAGMLVGQSRELMAALSLVENVSHVHMLSEPSLIATDSIPAAINVGTQVPVTTSSTTLPAGGSVAVTQSVTGVNTGITLIVNARINSSGFVTLQIDQENSNPTSGGGNSLTPSFSQQTVQTQLEMRDGDTVAIGGVIGENTSSGTQGIPLLSHIPYLGALFGSHTYSHERTELIIFMTPHVIYDTTDLLEASDELKARVKALKRDLRKL